MTNISWLKSLATLTDYDNTVGEILNALPSNIQAAYRNNDHTVITTHLNGSDHVPFKQGIFQL